MRRLEYCYLDGEINCVPAFCVLTLVNPDNTVGGMELIHGRN